MAYRGKPSGGCSSCRERKIRCDQQKPGCGQCGRRQQACPGYRNLVDLMFRDESRHVVRKAKAKARKKSPVNPHRGSSSPDAKPGAYPTPGPRGTPPPSPAAAADCPPRQLAERSAQARNESPPPPSADPRTQPATPGPRVSYSLAPSYRERGTAYFFSRYVTADENSCHSRFDFVYDVWKPASLGRQRRVDSVLASMTAVGLAGLGDMTGSAEILEASRKSYGAALQLISLALGDPAEAVKDTTMLAVLILGLFEMTVDAPPKTVKTWQEHVNGAVALASMRGASQFKTPGRVKMFLMLCYRVMISCIQTQMPMPEGLLALGNELSRAVGDSDQAWKMAMPAYRILKIRHQAKKVAASDPEHVLDHLAAASEEIEGLSAGLPSYAAFEMPGRRVGVFGTAFHVYPRLWLASLWNNVRVCRIHVLEDLVGEFRATHSRLRYSPDYHRHLEQFHEAEHELRRLCEAILASTPQQVGLIHAPAGKDGDLASNKPTISSVAITQARSLPSSPLSRSPSSSGEGNATLRDHRRTTRLTGASHDDPTPSGESEEEVRRFMLLASATNAVVWPLYVVGMSSSCTGEMKTYVVERLRALDAEMGQRQAGLIADLVELRELPYTEGTDAYVAWSA